jgi:hypothetical protein
MKGGKSEASSAVMFVSKGAPARRLFARWPFDDATAEAVIAVMKKAPHGTARISTRREGPEEWPASPWVARSSLVIRDQAATGGPIGNRPATWRYHFDTRVPESAELGD